LLSSYCSQFGCFKPGCGAISEDDHLQWCLPVHSDTEADYVNGESAPFRHFVATLVISVRAPVMSVLLVSLFWQAVGVQGCCACIRMGIFLFAVITGIMIDIPRLLFPFRGDTYDMHVLLSRIMFASDSFLLAPLLLTALWIRFRSRVELALSWFLWAFTVSCIAWFMFFPWQWQIPQWLATFAWDAMLIMFGITLSMPPATTSQKVEHVPKDNEVATMA